MTKINATLNRKIERINFRFAKGWVDQVQRQRMLRVLRVWAVQKYEQKE